MAQTFNFVEAGETLTLSIGPRGETGEFVVAESCSAEPHGRWGCTCGEDPPHNLGLANHEGEGHRVFWICFEHGPETVPADDRG